MINTSKINGKKGAYLQPIKQGKNESGRYAVLHWEGTRNEVMFQASWVEQMGGTWEFTDSFTGGKCVLEGRIPRDIYQQEQPVDTWEFFAAIAEKDILASDIAAVQNFNDENLENIRFYLQNPPPAGTTPTFTNTGDRTNAVAIYNLMRAGLQSIRVNVPTLRNTVTVSNVYALQVSLANVGRIISTGSLRNLEAVPAGTVALLPNDSTNKTGFGYGWYKKHPTIRAGARQKTQIEREWEYGLWPTLIYQSIL